MSRWVTPRTVGLRAGVVGKQPSGIGERLALYIPGEIVTAFTLLFSALAAMNVPESWRPCTALLLIGLFFVTTIAYVARFAPAGAVRKAHLIVAPVAFLAWAYPIASSLLGGWFVGLVSFGAQAVVIALAIIVAPTERLLAPNA